MNGRATRLGKRTESNGPRDFRFDGAKVVTVIGESCR